MFVWLSLRGVMFFSRFSFRVGGSPGGFLNRFCRPISVLALFLLVGCGGVWRCSFACGGVLLGVIRWSWGVVSKGSNFSPRFKSCFFLVGCCSASFGTSESSSPMHAFAAFYALCAGVLPSPAYPMCDILSTISVAFSAKVFPAVASAFAFNEAIASVSAPQCFSPTPF